ncbi:MAG: acyl carrier protein [Ignavibacteria bacterium]|nr:acyl carrier protein [Ignavibacteria bacterium]
MKETIKNILFEILDTDISENASKDTTANWDSINHIRIIMELQEQFQVEIPAADIDKLYSVTEIQAYLQARLVQ